MALKIQESVDRAEKEREEEEKREKAGQEHFKKSGLSTPWKLAPIVANVADAVTTKMVLDRGGNERNPLMRGLVKKPLLHAAVKTAGGLATSYIADKVAKKHKTAGKILAGAGTAIPAAVTANNVAVIRRLDKKNKGK